MSTTSDSFKDFFKDTISNIVILVSATLFIVFYVILKAADVNNKNKIMTYQILLLISIITFIVTIVTKFIPNMFIIQRIVLFLLNFWEYIKIAFYYIINFCKRFFINLIDAVKEIGLSIIFPDLYVILRGIGILILLAMVGYSLYNIGININIEKIKQYGQIKQYGGVKKIIYSIFIFLLFLSVLYNILPQLYSSDKSPGYKAALLVGIIILVSMLLAGFFMKEIFEGNYRNYGMLLFNILIFLAFIYFIYGIKKFFFDQKPVTMETYSNFEYFLYYYLFPICFFIGYIIYYVYIYRKEKLSYTDFSDYRVIIFNVLSGIIGLYLIYQFIIKTLLSASVDNSILHFIQSVFKVIPCIFSVLFEYLIKNPLTAVLSIGISALFIFLTTLITGNVDYNSWYMILLYIIGIIIFIAGIIKLLLATTSLGESKVFQLLQKTIFALPCLFLLGIDNAFISKKFGTIPEFLFIILILFFIFFYNAITTSIIPDLYEKYILNDGKQVINNPISLSNYTFVSSYENLFNFNNTQSEDNKDNLNKFDYKYGLSFWFYLDSFPPLNSELYDICCLGDGLMIKYNPLENALYFMYNGVNAKNMIDYDKDKDKNKNKDKENFENKKPLTIKELNRWNQYQKRQKKMENFLSKNRFEGFKNETEDTTEPTEIIIHKELGILLQRWNNIIINYHSGTLDIFINGKLIKSKINVVPYIINTALTVGKNDGINGDICNLIYYKSPMSKSDIYRMYNIFKNKNPPVINKSDTNIMNFGESLEIYFKELLTKTDKDNKND
jgi:hypothetical protein